MIIDSHCHLTDEKFSKGDLSKVLAEATVFGISKFVTIGTYIKDNDAVIDLIKKYDNVYGVVGIYPHEELNKPLDELLSKLHVQCSTEKIVGIGECGMDLGAMPDGEGRNLEAQLELFEAQVLLAIEKNLPLVIHNRNADEYVLKILDKYKSAGVKGIAHCFVSTLETANRFLDLGFYISFSGIITYPSGKNLHEVVANVPMDKILIETDSPYLSPQGYRDKVNEPKYVKIVAEKVAAIRNTSVEEIERITYQNTCRAFNI